MKKYETLSLSVSLMSYPLGDDRIYKFYTHEYPGQLVSFIHIEVKNHIRDLANED